MKSLPALFAFVVFLGPMVRVSFAQSLPHPVLYVTQVPTWRTSGTVTSIAGTHLATPDAAPRGGGLMIRYPDGSTRNLTRAAGSGIEGVQQGPNAIAVRDPSVHWSGKRALFSMVVGAPSAPDDPRSFHWQLFEITGLGKNDTPTIVRLDGQPADFNNIQPAYTSGERIFFVSDRTLDGSRALYPARDEQGADLAVTGLWALDPAEGRLTLIDHSPSGSFKPFVDSFGRVVFSRWDHLQRDTFAPSRVAVDFESEKPTAAYTALWSDIFPEMMTPLGTETGHAFDHFLPWVVNQDGSGLLTMNHLGRHELGLDFPRARTDANLIDFTVPDSGTHDVGEPTRAGSYLQLAEDRARPGTYIATDAVSTAVSAGRLIALTAPPAENGDGVIPRIVSNVGLARDAAFLSDGRLLGSFTTGPMITGSYGSQTPTAIPPDFIPTAPFRIGIDGETAMLVTPGSTATVVNISSDGPRSFSGLLWELQATEVIARPVPPFSAAPVDPVEASVFRELRVSLPRFQAWLESNRMALLVSRNITARDHRDKQQPYNLYVPGGIASLADGGPAYPVTQVQFFQGDYVRAYADEAGNPDAEMGRRVTPRILHSSRDENPATALAGSTPVSPDGSMAMLVPAERALTWQLSDPAGNGVVRERYWLSFKAGEIRTCANCHGNNTADQLGRPPVSNPPQALRVLLTDFVRRHPEANLTITPYEQWAETAIGPEASATGDADQDGPTNLEEFAYGTDPLSPVGTEASPVAIPLRAGIVEIGPARHARLTFTRRTGETGPHLTVESSANLSDWVAIALISTTSLETPGPVTVLRSQTTAQSTAGLEQIEISLRDPLASAPVHFRLRLESR